MKTLKFKIVSENTNTMILQVVEQSHRGDGFGGNNDNVWLASNSVRFASATQPAYYEPWDQCYVRGYYESCDDNEITVAHAIGLRIIHAAVEYNRVFGDTDQPAVAANRVTAHPHESGPGLAVQRGIGRCECGAYPFGKCSRCGRTDYRLESVTRETNRRMR